MLSTDAVGIFTPDLAASILTAWLGLDLACCIATAATSCE
jgi:hypothetical protein